MCKAICPSFFKGGHKHIIFSWTENTLIEKYTSDLTIFIFILIEYLYLQYLKMTVHISFMISNFSSYIRLWVRIPFCDWGAMSWEGYRNCLVSGLEEHLQEPYEMSIEWEVNRQPFSSDIYRYAFAFISLGNINAKLKWIIVIHATDIAILGVIQWMWKILKSDNFFQPTTCTSENTVRRNKHMDEPYITVLDDMDGKVSLTCIFPEHDIQQMSPRHTFHIP